MKKILFTLVLFFMAFTSRAQNVKLGDLNHDNDVNISDVMMLVDIVINGYKPFYVEPTEVTMSMGSTATLEIFGGYYTYSVSSANPDVVEVSLNGTTVTLSAVAGGETMVTVRDIQTFRTIEVPVKVNYNSLGISSSELSLVVGAQGTVSIISGSGSYSVESSDTGVATATVNNGKVTVTAVGAGTASITVIDRRSGETATIEVTVSATPTSYLTCPDGNHPHLIDLGLPSGTKWACCNVDTDHPENQSPTNYGGYYAWGETETKSTYSWSTYTHCDGSYSTCHNLGSDIAGTQYDVAHVKWGGSWVMPTKEQQEELRSKCTSTWTTQNGVSGRLFSGKNGGSIFLPAAGNRYGSDLDNAGSSGYCWSSTQYPSSADYAYNLYFDSGGAYTYGYYRYYGRCVRPVSRN